MDAKAKKLRRDIQKALDDFPAIVQRKKKVAAARQRLIREAFDPLTRQLNKILKASGR